VARPTTASWTTTWTPRTSPTKGVGDWKGDLVVGVRSQSAGATLVDRRTRYLRLVPLPEGHSAGPLRDALITVLGQLPGHARRSLTWDQASEMARHHELAP
jgi:IS30 family transposase